MLNKINCREISQDILAIVLSSLIISLLLTKGEELKNRKSTATLLSPNTTELPIRTISSGDLQTLLDNNINGNKITTTIIDTRENIFYQLGHIPQAINVPISESEKFYQTTMQTLKGMEKIIVYCARQSCDDSEKMAKQLTNMGYTNVVVYKGGYDAWKDWEGSKKEQPQ